MPKPEVVTEHIQAFIERYEKLTGSEGRSSVRDMLTDLMHLCDARGFDFDEALDGAREVYEQEIAQNEEKVQESEGPTT
jgi:uncharacterized protein (UPF0335 family)